VELESVLRQSQLQALRSQLNPHFLFNTLHSIAELVHENPKLAETLLVRLGALLRKALAPRVQHEVTLAEEIDFIRGYLEIEQMRLGARLQVEWEIAPEALDCKIPGMILQPLIENSIRHGIAPLDGPGKLKISARRRMWRRRCRGRRHSGTQTRFDLPRRPNAENERLRSAARCRYRANAAGHLCNRVRPICVAGI
jgi:sensor histidine kinase YesM